MCRGRGGKPTSQLAIGRWRRPTYHGEGARRSAFRSRPFDPFQRSPAPVAEDIQALARQWDDLTRQIDDDCAYNRATLADAPFGGDKLTETLWAERAQIEARIFAHPEPSLGSVAIKLRMVAWSMNVQESEYANHDGVRTNELAEDEKTIAGALADAERLIAG
jgi:hypothetical protein